MKLKLTISQLYKLQNSSLTIHHSPLDLRPFGLKIAGMTTITGSENKYTYNGKEPYLIVNDELLMVNSSKFIISNSQFTICAATDPEWQTSSPYLFCGNSPVMYTDPDGEFFWAAAIVGGLAVYNGIRTAEAADDHLAFVNGFFRTILTATPAMILTVASIGTLSPYTSSWFLNSTVLMKTTAVAISSSISSTIICGYTTTGIGPYSYNWKSGKGEFANPFDKENLFTNFLDFVSYYSIISGLVDEHGERVASDPDRSTESKPVPRFLKPFVAIAKFTINKVFLAGQSNYAGMSDYGPVENSGKSCKFLDGSKKYVKNGMYGGYGHDDNYWKEGVSGISGALFSQRVRYADIRLTTTSFKMIFNASNGYQVWGALNMGIAFSAISTVKSVMYIATQCELDTHRYTIKSCGF